MTGQKTEKNKKKTKKIKTITLMGLIFAGIDFMASIVSLANFGHISEIKSRKIIWMRK